MPVALVTGASRGLGLALARRLSEEGWDLVIDARHGRDLEEAAAQLGYGGRVVAIAGDVADEQHRGAMLAAVERLGRLDALVNNASLLGPSPQPPLQEYPMEVLEEVYRVNAVAPLRMIQIMLPLLRRSDGRVLNITSDAAVEPYEGWGGYGSSKAALEHLSRILAVEHPDLKVYAVDPGDMNTRMHQEAFPGEDISDRSPPEASVPGLLRLIQGELPSGRYQARDLVATVPG
jgi:NAD(P)-dependent dehydrogenase (short-subunit alcohol dehydrogenase family)